MADKVKILVTGASGFIGSWVCEEGLRRGYSVWAGLRATSSRRWLQSEWLHVQRLTLDNPAELDAQLLAFKQLHGRWDFIIHAAGATKCRDEADFERVNYQGTVHLVEALQRLDMMPRLLLYLSSLSVLGPIREPQDFGGQFLPLTANDTPCPNTAYGRSKWKAEQYLQGLGSACPCVIFRPTGVYGPRERDYYLMAKSIKRHVDFAAGRKPQHLTFVYVRDVVGALYAAIDRTLEGQGESLVGGIFHLSDGQSYASRTFSDLIKEQLGVGWWLRLRAPLWLLLGICSVSAWWANLWGKASTLNGDKYRIMSQRNWECDITPLRTLLGYEPQWPLREGVRETVAWYLKNKWL